MLRDSMDFFLSFYRIIIILILDRDRAMQFLCELTISENTLDTYVYSHISIYIITTETPFVSFFFDNGCVLSAKALPGIAICVVYFQTNSKVEIIFV